MNYTDISKQRKISSKDLKGKGKARLPILFGAILVVGTILYFSRDYIIRAFNPISIVGGSTKLNIRQTDGRTNILLLGSDKRNLGAESGRNTLTDTILVASIGNIDNDVVLISLPRDLWVSNYTLKNDYTYSSKINEVYTNAGIEELRNQMEVVLGIPMHYHVLVTFDLFENVMNILGGIDINVERSFTDNQYPIEGKEADTCGVPKEEIEKLEKEAEENEEKINYFSLFPCRYQTIEFKEGLQKMDGETALKYARSRHGNNREGTDFARSKRQQNLIMAIKNKALSLETLINPSKLKDLYDQYASNVETDIDISSVQSFFLLSQRLDFEKVISIVLDDRSDANEGGLLYNPTNATLYRNQYVLVPQTGDFSQIHAYVQKYLFGNR
ncbi:LCP family protein [Patescibacteria group bacterium]|nr:LCP family protein [Patescibacteria group bacterium]